MKSARGARAGQFRRRESSQHDKAPRKAAALFARRLVIMVKVPVAGRIKTRLARSIGPAHTVRFYRTVTASLVARLARAPFWRTILAVTPDAHIASRALPACIARMPQGVGDIGARMHRPMRLLPPGPVCVIGSDIPGIRIEHILRAFRGLGAHDAVFGPAEDGGFWLVGMRRRPVPAFPYTGVRWSSAQTLADTLVNLAGFRIAFTARLADVDDEGDLARQRATAERRIPPLSGSRPAQSLARDSVADALETAKARV